MPEMPADLGSRSPADRSRGSPALWCAPALLLASSCSLLVIGIEAPPCDPATFVRGCDNNLADFCERGAEIFLDCGAAGCDPPTGLCQSCGDGPAEPGE